MKTIPITFAVESERPVRVKRRYDLCKHGRPYVSVYPCADCKYERAMEPVLCRSRYFWPVTLALLALSLWAGWSAIR